MADLRCANAKRNCAEGSVGRRMAIAANNGHAWLCCTELWSHDMDNTSMLALPAMGLNAVLLRVRQKCLDLRFGLFRMVRPRAVGIDARWRRMIDGRQCAVWTADL